MSASVSIHTYSVVTLISSLIQPFFHFYLAAFERKSEIEYAELMLDIFCFSGFSTLDISSKQALDIHFLWQNG